MRRRRFLGASAAVLAAPALRLRAETSVAASFLELARDLASRPYRAPEHVLPPPFAGLDYDAYRGIRPIPGRGALIPHGQDYAVDLLPPGLFFPHAVTVEIAGPDGVREVPFSTDLFSFEFGFAV